MQMEVIEKPRVTEERERELLKNGNAHDFSALQQKSAEYKAALQEESLGGLPEHMQWLYRITDYLGMTTPDKRLRERLKASEVSCTRQKLLSQQYESRIREHEQIILEREQELMDCEFCYEKRKLQLEEGERHMQALANEKNGYLQLLKQDGNSKDISEMVSKISAKIFEMRHGQRILEREKNEFASRIVECDSAVREAENTLTALSIYSAVLQKSHIRSRIEIMRLKPLLSSGNSPVETIDNLVEDQRLSEQTEKIADTMSGWVYDMTSDISEIAIRTKKRKNLYDSLKDKRTGSVSDINSMAERIIYSRNDEGK